MIIFERFIARSGIDIYEFCRAQKINTDEGLKSYCIERGMTAPVAKYFEVAKVKEETVSNVKTKVTKSRKAPAKKSEEDKPKEPTKKPRVTRTRRTKKQSK